MNWDECQFWNSVLPPSRPTIEELDRLKSLLLGYDLRSEIAVLGATPEYRELLAQLGFLNVTVIDRSLAFIDQVQALCPSAKSENIIVADWSNTLTAYPQKFSLILSHLTSGNVPYPDRAILYDTIRASLAEGGVFVDTALTHRAGLLDPDYVLYRYSLKPINLATINHFNCEFVFCTKLIEEDKCVRPARLYEYAVRHSQSPAIHRIVDFCMQITPPDACWYYGIGWKEEASMVATSFITLAEFAQADSSPYRGQCFQRILAPRRHD